LEVALPRKHIWPVSAAYSPSPHALLACTRRVFGVAEVQNTTKKAVESAVSHPGDDDLSERLNAASEMQAWPDLRDSHTTNVRRGCIINPVIENDNEISCSRGAW
jgi:hypothetical protein